MFRLRPFVACLGGQSSLSMLLVMLFASASNAANVYTSSSGEIRSNSPSQHCTDFNPQHGLDIEQIMGIWYGNEVITHDSREEGEVVYKTCVVIHLADVTNETTSVYDHSSSSGYSGRSNPSGTNYDRFGTSYGYGSNGGRSAGSMYDQQQHQQNRRQQGGLGGHQYQQQEPRTMRNLRLIWDELEHTLEYTLRYNTSKPGFWISASPQSGSMIQLQYVQFTGTVQVLKAINNQLVLNFCQSLPGGQLFTIVLSRLPMGLGPEDIQSIRNLLRRRGLSTTSVRKVCQNGAFRSDVSMIALALMAIVTALVKRLH
uniref:Lipocalin/cytosolic fatty-acid binding domain-containing protein n=1 Tax=Anopheles funestus TaxID=62324 RepID=A0A182RDB8_ANOFN